METGRDQSVAFHDFLGRMKHVSSIDLVRSIKSFLVPYSFQTLDSATNGNKVQEFFVAMEAAFMDHPLWANATDEDMDCSLEGLEKYVMAKLYPKTFAFSAEDIKTDQLIFDRVEMLRTFLRPEHLDIPSVLHDEASLQLASEELLKINSSITPREKLISITNCCKIISNLMLNASKSKDHILSGADEFLPLLIYVTIKANPPNLHSNVQYIKLYRRRAKLIAGPAYYLTSLESAKTFIVNITAKSLSIGENDFNKNMQVSKLSRKAVSAKHIDEASGPSMKDNDYPYMDSEAGDLTIKDVETLLSLYKEVVTQYKSLRIAEKH